MTGILYKIINYCKCLFIYFKVLFIKIIVRKKILFLVGVPLHGNLGDQAITYAETKFIEEQIPNYEVIEISSPFYVENHIRLKKSINNQIVLIHGGGFMGTLWIQEEKMLRFAIMNATKSKIIVLPQSIYYENSDFGESELRGSQIIYGNHPDLHICAREEYSYEFMQRVYPRQDILLIPDMVLYLNQFQSKFNRKGALVCLRYDKESVLTNEIKEKIREVISRYTDNINYTDTVIKARIKRNKRFTCLKNKLEEFQKAKIVITDRLHGMVFSAITGTPCLVFGNCYHKVEGVYQWIKNFDYIQYITDIDELPEQMGKLMQLEECRFDNEKFKSYYEKLTELIHNT